MTTLYTDSARYADHDDCLAAAVDDIVEALDLDGWVLTALWADAHRNEISVVVPDDLDDDQIPTGWRRWRYAV